MSCALHCGDPALGLLLDDSVNDRIIAVRANESTTPVWCAQTSGLYVHLYSPSAYAKNCIFPSNLLDPCITSLYRPALLPAPARQNILEILGARLKPDAAILLLTAEGMRLTMHRNQPYKTIAMADRFAVAGFIERKGRLPSLEEFWDADATRHPPSVGPRSYVLPTLHFRSAVRSPGEWVDIVTQGVVEEISQFHADIVAPSYAVNSGTIFNGSTMEIGEQIHQASVEHPVPRGRQSAAVSSTKLAMTPSMDDFRL